ncbi:MAG: PQQ-dependent sugar dehydrogenase [Polyangiaceae bacterium]|nr:PQQ-dependent sugar dehydrogenase [Polyangiaceae bacterium]
MKRATWVGSVALVLVGLGLWAGGCGSDDGGGSQGGASSSTSTGAGGGSGGGGSTTTGTGGAGGGTSTGTGAGGEGPVCPPAPSGPPPALKLTQVATGLSKPVLAIGAPGDTTRLYIVEQTGLIKILKSGVMNAEPFLSTVGLSSSGSGVGSERGLLGLAFHPDYAQNGRFFIYYTAASNGAITVAEYARSAANPDVASPQAVKKLLEITDGLHAWGNHNGGSLAFGPDGYLYAGVGDGGGSGDPNGHGQDTTIKLGKILRFDVDAHPQPPPGNLPGGDPDIWDYGLRNPWRFSFDRCNGDLYIGDVGQGSLEEVDVEPAGQGHRNYGWNIMEGTGCFGGGSCETTGMTLPVAEYTHGDGCSITGGFVYRGSSIPNLAGTYFYGDYCTNRVWTLVWDGGAVTSQAEVTADLQSDSLLQGISSFGQDTRGEIYVCDIGGSVYRIDAE